MALNAIGPYQFLALHGVPVGISEDVVAMSRGGVDGNVFLKTGHRGREFVVRSMVDLMTGAWGIARYKDYRELVGTLQDLVWAGYVWTTATVRCMVVDVTVAQPAGLRALLFGVGGINPPSYALLECEWKLCFVDISGAS